MAYVPDTNTFSLQDVVDAVGPSSNDLNECFNDALGICYDSAYEQNKDQLDDFRNWDSAYSSQWLGYITWVITGVDASNIYFEAYNASNARNNLSDTVYWQAMLAGSPVDSGSVSSGTLNGGNTSYPSSSWSNPIYDQIEVSPDGYSNWVSLYP